MAYTAARRYDIDFGSVLAFVLMFLFLIMSFFTYKWGSENETASIHSSCNPREYVQELQVPRLRDHTLLNSSIIIIGLEFERGAALPGDVAMYRDLSLRLYYGEGEDPVATRAVPRFRMGDRRSVRQTVVVVAPRLPWEDPFSKISGTGPTVLLRLVLFGKFRARERRDAGFRCQVCACEWSEFEAEAEVLLDAHAHILSNTPILFNE